MTDRPKWVMNLWLYISDSLVVNDDCLGFPQDGSDDDLLDKIEDAVNAILCGHYGHSIINDQCGIPEHRFCEYCHKRESAC